MRKFTALSDMHGILPELEDKPDILLIGGDIVPLRIQMSSDRSKKWLRDEFIPWCERNCNERAYVIAGNHDMWLYYHGNDKFKPMLPEKVVYLENEVAVCDDVVIVGSPMCKEFGNWWFMHPNFLLRERYDRLIAEVDKVRGDKTVIFLTHDAPLGTSDVLLQKDCRWADGSHIGSIELEDTIKKMRPDIVLHGHLHSTNHDLETMNDGFTSVYNVSLVDEDYAVAYKPLEFKI